MYEALQQVTGRPVVRPVREGENVPRVPAGADLNACLHMLHHTCGQRLVPVGEAYAAVAPATGELRETRGQLERPLGFLASLDASQVEGLRQGWAVNLSTLAPDQQRLLAAETHEVETMRPDGTAPGFIGLSIRPGVSVSLFEEGRVITPFRRGLPLGRSPGNRVMTPVPDRPGWWKPSREATR